MKKALSYIITIIITAYATMGTYQALSAYYIHPSHKGVKMPMKDVLRMFVYSPCIFLSFRNKYKNLINEQDSFIENENNPVI